MDQEIDYYLRNLEQKSEYLNGIKKVLKIILEE